MKGVAYNTNELFLLGAITIGLPIALRFAWEDFMWRRVRIGWTVFIYRDDLPPVYFLLLAVQIVAYGALSYVWLSMIVGLFL